MIGRSNRPGVRDRLRNYKDGKLAEVWRGPRTAAGEGWVSESVPERNSERALTPVAAISGSTPVIRRIRCQRQSLRA
jgi:hypothetical protein